MFLKCIRCHIMLSTPDLQVCFTSLRFTRQKVLIDIFLVLIPGRLAEPIPVAGFEASIMTLWMFWQNIAGKRTEDIRGLLHELTEACR